MNKKIILITFLILVISFSLPNDLFYAEKISISNEYQLNFYTTRRDIADVVVISDNDPFFGIIGSSVACWYDFNNNSDGLLPLIVQNNGKLNNNQEKFLWSLLKSKNKELLVLGNSLKTTYKKTEILGSPPDVSIKVATHVFDRSSTILIIPYKNDNSYTLGLKASPMASYLNIPILIYDDNLLEINQVCSVLGTTDAYVIGDLEIEIQNVTNINLKTEDEIQNELIHIIKDQFREINYLTITNPSDSIPPSIISDNTSLINMDFKNVQLTVLGRKINIIGSDTKNHKIKVSDGINKIKINGNIISNKKPIIDYLNPVEPIIFMTLFDPNENIVAYSNSLAYETGQTYIETLTCNRSGDFTLKIRVYNGLKGGYFVQRGISVFNSNIKLNINISKLENPHMPLIPKLSIMAPYLTSAHGGILIADPDFELTSDEYKEIADGTGSGPSYNEDLHFFNNQKVNYSIHKLKDMFVKLDENGLLDGFFSGPAWLAILAGTNMVPMYYYGPSQYGIPEKGLPSDNPYSMNWNLSVGRIIGWDVQDVSLLISRTFFYEDICGEPRYSRDWHNKFSFIFGEGFGETGGIFHQIPYAFEIIKYGFKPRIFGDFKNGRQITDFLRAYTGSNYIEFLGHGDWFWYTPSLYGIDYYSKSVNVANAKKWVFTNPSVFLSSACLMGRIDGIPPEMNIGLAMLHAGCNCFVGATRETGSEAGLETLENHLIVDDYSVGEALRGEKRVDKELPTYYLRILYGDPAFNPYEPNNGFSDQGRPKMN